MSLAIKRRAASGPARIPFEKMFPSGVGIGLIGVLVILGVMFTASGPEKTAVAGSYLFAWIFWMTISLGAFGFVCLYHTVKGKWLLPGLRILESASGPTTMLVMAALFLPVALPVLFKQHFLYEWVDPHLQATELLLRWKAPYLNNISWFVRYIIWFGSWIAISAGFLKSTKRQEQTGDMKELVLRNNWGAAAFIWFFLSTTFCMTDWVMSLDYRWYSTMFGFWSVIIVGVGAFSFSTMIVCSSMEFKPFHGLISPAVTRDMANILFVLVMCWAYTSFSQYLIIWSGNLPEVNFYYIERSRFGWDIVGMATMLGEYFIPFVALLTPRNRKIPRNLAGVAGFILVMHLVDVYQYVMPAIRQNGPMPTLWDVLALCSVGVLWMGVVAGVMRQRALLPSFDARLEESLAH